MLAHQSTLILQGFSENVDVSQCNMLLLQEIEDLKRALEDDRNKYEEEVNLLQVIINNFVLIIINFYKYFELIKYFMSHRPITS